MEIRTKFNVGDKVYPIYHNSYKAKLFPSFSIEHIEIFNYDIIVYVDRLGHRFYEHNCFATKEEAQKECDKKNGYM